MGKGKKSRRNWSGTRSFGNGTLPTSELVGNMVEMPTICVQHSIFYPAQLAQLALRGEHHVFHTSCECGNGYIVATQKDGAHTRRGGPIESIVDMYEEIPWREIEIVDRNGLFVCKRAPSHEALLAYFLQ